MTRKGAIKKLATEVMGWEFSENSGCYYDGDKFICSHVDFDPYANSADCDALIEAFVGKWNPDYLSLQYKSSLQDKDNIHEGFVEVGYDDYASEAVSGLFKMPYTTAKKNEAVCEAILKAIEEAK